MDVIGALVIIAKMTMIGVLQTVRIHGIAAYIIIAEIVETEVMMITAIVAESIVIHVIANVIIVAIANVIIAVIAIVTVIAVVVAMINKKYQHTNILIIK